MSICPNCGSIDGNFEKALNELHMSETARRWVASYVKVSSPRGAVGAWMDGGAPVSLHEELRQRKRLGSLAW